MDAQLIATILGIFALLIGGGIAAGKLIQKVEDVDKRLSNFEEHFTKKMRDELKTWYSEPIKNLDKQVLDLTTKMADLEARHERLFDLYKGLQDTFKKVVKALENHRVGRK